MTIVRSCLALGLAAFLNAGCEKPPSPPGAPFAAATSLQAIPLGPPPGESPTAAAVRNPFEGDPDAVPRGKALFGSMNCVYCHGSDGAGLIGPPLNGRGWRYGGTPAQIYNSIHDGRPQGMPAWDKSLPPEEIWRIVAYLETLRGPLTPSPTGAQVAGQSSADAAETARQAANAEPVR